MRGALRLELLETRDTPSGSELLVDPFVPTDPALVTPPSAEALAGDIGAGIVLGVQYPNAAQPGSSATPPLAPSVSPTGPVIAPPQNPVAPPFIP